MHMYQITGRPKVWEFGNEKDEYRRDSLKLLTLFGKSNGDLEWNLNKYSDGSGAQYIVMPATSYDEAMEFARQSVLDRATASADKPREDVIKAAEEFGVQLEPTYIAKFKALMLDVERSKFASSAKGGSGH